MDPVRLDRTGHAGPTPQQARGRRWRKSSWGLFVPADVERTPEQRIVEAAAVLPHFGGVSGWAGLRWQGAQWFDGVAADGTTLLPVTLATSEADIRGQAGFRVSAERLGPDELMLHDGLTITTAIRSVTFEMRYAANVRAAVVVADMAMYADLVSTGELARGRGEPGMDGMPPAPRGAGSGRRERMVAPGDTAPAGLDVGRRASSTALQHPRLRPLGTPHRDSGPAR